MITLTVQHYNGSPLPQALTVNLDEMGGTVGRAPTNHLVLPDPERTISRVHAQIVYRHGAYWVIDRGSNPIQLNGRTLGNGQEAALAHGDQLAVGGYVIDVAQTSATLTAASVVADTAMPSRVSQGNDPFADFAGIGVVGNASSVQSAQDPLAAFGWGGAAQNSQVGCVPESSTFASSGIPDDWDPFATPLAPAPLGQGSVPVIPDLPSPAPPSLDTLFALGAAPSVSGLGGGLFDSPVHAPNTSAVLDPLQSLNMAAPQVEAPVPDHVSALHEPFVAAPSVAVRGGFEQSEAPTSPETESPAHNVVLSWDDGAQEGRTVIRAKARAVVPAEQQVQAPIATPMVTSASVAFAATQTEAPALTVMMPPSTTQPEGDSGQERVVSARAVQPAADDANKTLIAALEQGLGVSLPQGQALTPELMHLMGALLRDATQGTVDLLVARAAIKREVRADVTMIAAKENNPLKFSPSAEVALHHLLGAPVRGFMPAPLAMQDAYNDLRAHQFAFVAGMKAALEGVLLRFDPQHLEGKLEQKSGLSSFLMGSRKARMWELFIDLYAQISSEAADDFHELFGKAFLRAYETHLDQLHSEHSEK